MPLTLVEALSCPYPCSCDCFHALDPAQRTADVAALFRIDDALRGWGYQPLYELAGDGLYRQAQAANDPAYRGIAVRDDACTHRRLVGFALHEVVHALEGDPSRANYGIPWGAPYGVPVAVPEGDEEAFLAPFNRAEARAFVGVAPLGRALFGIDWAVYTARDIGTYGLVGGNALVPVPAGFRPVPHWDRHAHRARYYALGRELEAEARAYFSDERLVALAVRFAEAEARGRALRKRSWPAPAELARLQPRLPGRNDLCICGSGAKYKKCCGATAPAW